MNTKKPWTGGRGMSVCCEKCGIKLIPYKSHNCVEELKAHIVRLESQIQRLKEQPLGPRFLWHRVVKAVRR